MVVVSLGCLLLATELGVKIVSHSIARGLYQSLVYDMVSGLSPAELAYNYRQVWLTDVL
jgi:hypothetical protein